MGFVLVVVVVVVMVMVMMTTMMIIYVCCEVEQIICRNPERGSLKDSNYVLVP
jgi:hypothetical protein